MPCCAPWVHIMSIGRGSSSGMCPCMKARATECRVLTCLMQRWRHRKLVRSAAPCMQAMVAAWQTSQGQLLSQPNAEGQAGSRLPGA